MKTQINLITAKDEFELIKKFNEDNNYFASQPIQKIDGSWVMFCYSQEEILNNTSEPLENEKPSKQLATKSQLNYYKAKKWSVPKGLTKQEAWKKISEDKK
jgi:hypothetical protein